MALGIQRGGFGVLGLEFRLYTHSLHGRSFSGLLYRILNIQWLNQKGTTTETVGSAEGLTLEKRQHTNSNANKRAAA